MDIEPIDQMAHTVLHTEDATLKRLTKRQMRRKFGYQQTQKALQRARYVAVLLAA